MLSFSFSGGSVSFFFCEEVACFCFLPSSDGVACCCVLISCHAVCHCFLLTCDDVACLCFLLPAKVGHATVCFLLLTMPYSALFFFLVTMSFWIAAKKKTRMSSLRGGMPVGLSYSIQHNCFYNDQWCFSAFVLSKASIHDVVQHAELLSLSMLTIPGQFFNPDVCRL